MQVHRRMPPDAVLTLLLAAPLLALLAAAQPSSPPDLRLRMAIELADADLQRSGWSPDGDSLLDSLDRELSGNTLASLRSCSGTGVGFCRYRYRRGTQQLEVITVPNSDGDGLVHHWDVSVGEP